VQAAPVAPVTAKFKTGVLINVVWITALLSVGAGHVVGSFILVGLCAAVFFAFKGNWYFNDSEKIAFPRALKSCAIDFLIVAIIAMILTGIGLLIIWLLEKIAAIFAR
jgi:hypothetical protein